MKRLNFESNKEEEENIFYDFEPDVEEVLKKYFQKIL